MPKRFRAELSDIADWHNVILATHKAAKAKKQRPAVQHFYQHFEASVANLQSCILRGCLTQGTYRAFTINDPKPRIIHAAPFEDRVVHHALINIIGSRMEQSWVDSSYACREGKGAHLVVIKAAELSRQYPVVVKMDIQAFFAHINHGVLSKLLERMLKPTNVFTLIQAILRSFSNGVGLPIGALTSQYFANHYLDGFQRWLRDDKRVLAELRYMDDVLVFTRSLAHGRQIASLACEWLAQERDLPLKPCLIQHTSKGYSFCGFKLSNQNIKLGKRRKRNIRCRLNELNADIKNNHISAELAQQQLHTIFALALPGEHWQWMQQTLEKYPDMLEHDM